MIARQSSKPRCGTCKRVLRTHGVHVCNPPKRIPRGARPKPKRRKPRRGRVIDKPRLDWAATQPCCITGICPATTHHVREFGSPKDDTRIIRLADYLHMATAARSGIPCVEEGKRRFEEFHGISIEAEVEKLREAYDLTNPV